MVLDTLGLAERLAFVLRDVFTGPLAARAFEPSQIPGSGQLGPMAQPTDDDARLIERMARGDGEAAGALYRRYLPLVLRWSLRETRNREVAADLASEVFAAALIASPRFRQDHGSVGSWLLGIAKNKLRESQRRQRIEHSARRALGIEPIALTDDALERVEALTPQCPLAGWVADKQPKVTQREVASPVRFTAVKARHYCSDGSQGYLDYAKPDLIGCDDGVPRGYQRWRWASPDQVLVTASFIARRSVTSTNSWYEWQIMNPGNGGGGGNRTQTDIRAGERVFLTIWVPASRFRGVFRGTVSFMANAGRAGPGGGDDPGYDGSVIVGRFSFRLH